MQLHCWITFYWELFPNFSSVAIWQHLHLLKTFFVVWVYRFTKPKKWLVAIWQLWTDSGLISIKCFQSKCVPLKSSWLMNLVNEKSTREVCMLFHHLLVKRTFICSTKRFYHLYHTIILVWYIMCKNTQIQNAYSRP